jgi:hypothetical protein
MLYKIFNSRIMLVIYFAMPILLLAAIAEPSPIGALNRMLSEKDGYLLIPIMLFLCGGSLAVGKFYITDKIMLRISNKALYYEHERKSKNSARVRREALDNFFLNTIPGCIIAIMGYSWMTYVFLLNPDSVFISRLVGIYFLFCDIMAISRFIKLSTKNN